MRLVPEQTDSVLPRSHIVIGDQFRLIQPVKLPEVLPEFVVRVPTSSVQIYTHWECRFVRCFLAPTARPGVCRLDDSAANMELAVFGAM